MNEKSAAVGNAFAGLGAQVSVTGATDADVEAARAAPKIEMCRAHYAGCKLGAAYVDHFIR